MTVINTMWGSFWISIGVLYAFVVSVDGLWGDLKQGRGCGLTRDMTGGWCS